MVEVLNLLHELTGISWGPCVSLISCYKLQRQWTRRNQPTMPGKFEIKRSKNGDFYFHLLAGNGENILVNETYKAKASAKNGIESVKRNCLIDERYERKDGKSGKPYFVLKARNHEA